VLRSTEFLALESEKFLYELVPCLYLDVKKVFEVPKAFWDYLTPLTGILSLSPDLI
jgi:hypothetical protein